MTEFEKPSKIFKGIIESPSDPFITTEIQHFHRDNGSYYNIILRFNLNGVGQYIVCAENDPRIVDVLATPPQISALDFDDIQNPAIIFQMRDRDGEAQTLCYALEWIVNKIDRLAGKRDKAEVKEWVHDIHSDTQLNDPADQDKARWIANRTDWKLEDDLEFWGESRTGDD